MNYFYLTTNTLNREPDVIKSEDYCHVKGKTDGSQTLIIVEKKLKHKDLQELTQEEAQATLDGWIDEENLTPSKDPEGNDMLQTRIDLNKFI